MIAKVRNIFNPYSEYCLSLSSCLDYARDTKENNGYFKIYTAVSRIGVTGIKDLGVSQTNHY